MHQKHLEKLVDFQGVFDKPYWLSIMDKEISTKCHNIKNQFHKVASAQFLPFQFCIHPFQTEHILYLCRLKFQCWAQSAWPLMKHCLTSPKNFFLEDSPKLDMNIRCTLQYWYDWFIIWSDILKLLTIVETICTQKLAHTQLWWRRARRYCASECWWWGQWECLQRWFTKPIIIQHKQ